MLKIKIICVGKFKEKSFIELEKEYLKRIRPFAKLKLIELSEVSYKTNDVINVVKLKEAELIKKHIPSNAIIILLEEKGSLRNSVEFANFINRVGNLGQELTFIIGSGVGLHESMRFVSNYQISLSSLTFTHNFARVLLEEQLYRACTIINNKTYHK